MSAHNKKRFKNLGKTIAVGLFALLMFTNIQVALSDNADSSSDNISILGIELQLFEGTTAYSDGGCGGTVYEEGSCGNGIEVYGFPCTSDFCGNASSSWMCMIELCQ